MGIADEVGAADAAGGSAHVRGMGALLTTRGVGVLSAVNGVAGGYADHVPVVHPTTGPATTTDTAGACGHHTAGDGDFERSRVRG